MNCENCVPEWIALGVLGCGGSCPEFGVDKLFFCGGSFFIGRLMMVVEAKTTDVIGQECSFRFDLLRTDDGIVSYYRSDGVWWMDLPAVPPLARVA